jgi:hypothetical protein
MNNRQLRVVSSIDGAIVFLMNVLNASPRIRVLYKQLLDAREAVDKAWVYQAGAAKSRAGPGKTVKAAKAHLRIKHLKPLADSGPDLLDGMPGIKESLRMPIRDASVEEHLEAVKRFTNAVRPHAKAFYKAGFDRAFLKQLDQAAVALKVAASDPQSARRALSQSTKQVARHLQLCRHLIKQLDSAIVAEYHDRPLDIKLWRGSKRIPARIGRPPKKRPPKD